MSIATDSELLDGVANVCIKAELLDDKDNSINVGEYVTRDGTDIHYVEEYGSDLVTVVCIVAPTADWTKPGEVEHNLTRRYSKINPHLLRFARSEHEQLRRTFPDGWKNE